MNGPQALDSDAALSPRSPTDPDGSDGLAPFSRPRQLVLLLDGTNNTLTGRLRDTNVLKLYEHLNRCADGSQTLYYDPGVGAPDSLPSTGVLDQAGRWVQRIYGLAYGRGIYENIRDAYLFLMRNWQPGDEIWLFGFSRGAFTARSISGMVHLFGIIDAQHESLLPTLLRVYFAKQPQNGKALARAAVKVPGKQQDEHTKFSRGDVAQQIREGFASGQRRDAWVKFVGVWDTVESVGLPVFGVQISSNSRIEGKRIAHVRHALALDELRLTFRPRIYNQPNDGSAATAQSLHQRWFHGVHSDVGGGYPHRQAGLSDRAFEWMVKEARSCALRCPDAPPSTATRKLHDTVHAVPWWALAGLTIRLPRWQAPDATVVEDESVQNAPPSTSVWGQPWDLGTVISLALAMVLVVVGYALQAIILSADWHAPNWGLPADLAKAQWALLCAPGAVLRSALGGGWFLGSIGWSMVADTLVLLPAYAFVFGRMCGWAYRSATGLRRAVDRRPPWHWLGLSPLVMVAGDVCENLLTLWIKDWTAPLMGPQLFVQWLTGVASASKFLGMTGCGVLVLLAIAKRLPPFRKRDVQPPGVPASDNPLP